MSAYVVSRAHIRFLVDAAMCFRADRHGPFRWYHAGESHLLTRETEDATGLMLWNENVKSVSYRYQGESEETLPGPCYDGPRYGYEHPCRGETLHKSIKPTDVLKAIACYEYQTCEHPEWPESEAQTFCRTLRDAAIWALPGMDDGPWGAPQAWEDATPQAGLPAGELVAFSPNPGSQALKRALGELD